MTSARARPFEETAGTRLTVDTPEGVPLRFTVAGAGERVIALLIDLAILGVSVALLVAMTVWAVGWAWGSSTVGAFTMLTVFLLRSFYFVGFELRWLGQTPGKRLMGLRVIERRGGPLSAEALVARNLVRELELYQPLTYVLAAETLWPDASGLARLLAGVWLLALLALPFFNRLRLRVGDLVAGTIVVVAPKLVLLDDLGDAPQAGVFAAARRAQAGVEFSQKQLDVYGIYELQVLEDVLRKAESGEANAVAALATVAERIQHKIGWQQGGGGSGGGGGGRIPDERFLRAFYAALRARLEQRLLLGERREDKYGGGK